jgi:DNA-binding MarR family transcriptional regulator
LRGTVRGVPHPRGKSLSEEIGRAITRARRLILAEARVRLEARGDDLFTWQVLNQLDRHGPLSQTDLAERVGHHPTGLSRLLSALERQKLVTRERDAADRRRVRVRLARPGKARVEAGRPAVRDAVDTVLRPLDEKRRSDLLALLERIADDKAR